MTMLLLLLSLACLVTSSPLNTDYQDDYPDNYDQTGLGEEEEVASTERVEMLSRPQQFTVTTGDKMVLPCRVQAEGPVSRIWSRPDQSSSSIITIGGPVLTRPEVFSLDQDTGSLVVSSATPELAGQYTCKIGVSQAVSVTHTLVVAAPGPDPVMTPSQRRDHHTSAASSTLPASSLALMVTLVVARWSLV